MDETNAAAVAAVSKVAPVQMQSASVKGLMVALCAAIPEIKTPEKTKTAKVRSKKGDDSSYEYKYADLPDILAAVLPPLCKHGLVLNWSCSPFERGVLLTGYIRHAESEQYISASIPLTLLGSAQEMGSLLSYNKRYIIGVLLPVAATEPDDDGARASHGAKEEEDAKQVIEEARKQLLARSNAVKKIEMPPAEAEKKEPTSSAEPAKTGEKPRPVLPKHLAALQSKLDDEGITRERFMEAIHKSGWLPRNVTFEAIPHNPDSTQDFVTKLLNPTKPNWGKIVKLLPPVETATQEATSFPFGANANE